MARQKKFLRTGYHTKLKLGLRRKNKLKYRKATGIDNKMRRKLKGRLRNVAIGFKGEKKNSGKINGLNPVLINNVYDLEKIGKDDIGIVAKVGMKNKLKIAQTALDKKISLHNLNAKGFLEKTKKELELKKEHKKQEIEKKKVEKKKAEKKAKEKEEQEKKETQKDDKEDNKNNEPKDKQDALEEKIKPDYQNESKKDVQQNNYGRGK